MFFIENSSPLATEDISLPFEIKRARSTSQSLSPGANLKSHYRLRFTNKSEVMHGRFVDYAERYGQLDHTEMKTEDITLYNVYDGFRSAYNNLDVNIRYILNQYRIVSLEQIKGWAWDAKDKNFG
jgi:hypothetical protein